MIVSNEVIYLAVMLYVIAKESLHRSPACARRFPLVLFRQRSAERLTPSRRWSSMETRE